jgi:general secretion pathway protein M
MSPWISRSAALGLLALLLLAAYALIVAPLMTRHEGYQQATQDLDQRLVHFEGLAAERKGVEDRLAAFRRQRGSLEVYLKNATSTLASAELQERIKQVVEGRGGTLVSTQTLPDRTDAGLLQVAIRVRMRGDTAALQKVVYALESERPLLFLDNLFIRSRMVRRGLVIGTAPDLDINFDVIGYMRAESGT